MPPSPQHRATTSWPVAFLITVIAAMVIGAGLYVFQSIRNVPRDVLEGGGEVLREVKGIAQAFRSGTVTTSFISYATEVSGGSYLQFATLRQMEVFERTDSASTLWGQLELPDVVVQATAPVEYTYYLDLERDWDMRLEGETLLVQAPRIEHNKPAVDASAIRYEIRTGSVFRDEDEPLSRLQEGITTMADHRARENVALVREVGRRKVAEFVENWVVQSFSQGSTYRVEVRFADETVKTPRPGASPVVETPGPGP